MWHGTSIIGIIMSHRHYSIPGKARCLTPAYLVFERALSKTANHQTMFIGQVRFRYHFIHSNIDIILRLA